MKANLVETGSIKPSPMDIFVGDVARAGEIAYRSGLKMSFPLWPRPFMNTRLLGETLLQGQVSIADALSSMLCEEGCNAPEARIRDAILKEVLGPIESELLILTPSKYRDAIDERQQAVTEQGMGAMDAFFAYRAIYAPGKSVGLRIATILPHVGYSFNALAHDNGSVSVKEKLVAGEFNIDNNGPHSLSGSAAFLASLS